MASTSEFMQTLVGLYQAINQKRYQDATVELQKHAGEREALGQLISLMGTSDNPEQFLPLLTEAAPHTGLSVASLLNMAQSTTPTTERQQAGGVQRARRRATPEQGAALDDETASHALTGGSAFTNQLSQYLSQQLTAQRNDPTFGRAALSQQVLGMGVGSAALQSATAALSPEQLTHAAQIGAGLAPSAGEQLGAATSRYASDVGYASAEMGNRLGWARLIQEGELGHLNLAIENARVQQAGHAGSIMPITALPELHSTLSGLEERLRRGQNVVERQQTTSSIRGIVDLINTTRVQNGMAPIQFPRIDPAAPDAGTGRGVFQRAYPLPMTNYQIAPPQPMNGQPSGTTLPPALFPQQNYDLFNRYR